MILNLFFILSFALIIQLQKYDFSQLVQIKILLDSNNRHPDSPMLAMPCHDLKTKFVIFFYFSSGF